MSINDRRQVRSYVRREGRITKAQWQAFRTGNAYMLATTDNYTRNSMICQQTNHLVLDIGFGMGQNLAAMGSCYPTITFIGIEVLTKGVGSLIHQLRILACSNVRIHHGDAVPFVARTRSATFDRVQVFFPDPWHKKRHHKRRLLSATFIVELARILKTKGILHIKTDCVDYAKNIELHVINTRTLTKASTNGSLQLTTPVSKFEQRAIHLGHSVFECTYIKSSSQRLYNPVSI